jgi:hypothetical protein
MLSLERVKFGLHFSTCLTVSTSDTPLFLDLLLRGKSNHRDDQAKHMTHAYGWKRYTISYHITGISCPKWQVYFVAFGRIPRLSLIIHVKP